MISDDAPVLANQPLEFSRRQFWRGALASWCIFMGVLLLALIVVGIQQSTLPGWGSPLAMIGVYLVYGVPIGGIVSAVAMLAGAPIAWWLGRMLSRTSHVPLHLLAYVTFGATIGASVMFVPPLLLGGTPPNMFGSPLTAVVMAVCALSVAGGWTYTYRRRF